MAAAAGVGPPHEDLPPATTRYPATSGTGTGTRVRFTLMHTKYWDNTAGYTEYLPTATNGWGGRAATAPAPSPRSLIRLPSPTRA